jgi:hypothetical protein
MPRCRSASRSTASVARLSIVPPKGGRPASKTELLALIESRGIVEGLLLDEINRAIAAGKADELVIARGREPEPGRTAGSSTCCPRRASACPASAPAAAPTTATSARSSSCMPAMP